ncbi:hypothetical protein BD311DRAFT_175135 [Dichomitus squalens]|uniref:Uncharacterized protein n=1 Tax=Dichomitus squalens TaxID=114155 RepID=A0A4Q9MU23_9APHY|nr:hypothetical protein BD311DRAFT_175135 [Dichomitus squalens]
MTPPYATQPHDMHCISAASSQTLRGPLATVLLNTPESPSNGRSPQGVSKFKGKGLEPCHSATCVDTADKTMDRVHTRGLTEDLRGDSIDYARYIRRNHFKTGDRVLVWVRRDNKFSWRHGVVPNLRHMRPIQENGQTTYPVIYQDHPRILNYFNPAVGEILYDELLSALDKGQAASGRVVN